MKLVQKTRICIDDRDCKRDCDGRDLPFSLLLSRHILPDRPYFRSLAPTLLLACSSLASPVALSQSDSSWQLSGSKPDDDQAKTEQIVPAETQTQEINLEFDVAVVEQEAEPQSGESRQDQSVTDETESAVSDAETDLATSEALEGRVANTNDQVAVQPVLAGVNTVSSVPIVDLPEGFREALERQFVEIQKLEEEEDAFSDSLGEAYFGYGNMLARAGRLDEARDMYAKSLHLAKINNGVYAIEQRPVLRALFDMHAAKLEVSEMETQLKQIIWLEKKNPDIRDSFTYDMVLRLGNLFIDQYYYEPKLTEAALERVNKAIHFLNYAVNRYGHVPLSERSMPFGELALLQFIKSTINRELDRSFYEQSRFRQFADLDKAPKARTGSNHLGNGLYHLRKYLAKAQQEGNIEHEVRALRDIGDMYLLFNQGMSAEKSYQMAWLKASQLHESHELVTSFDTPARLPDFNYAGEREEIINLDRVVSVPLNFDIDQYGRVKRIHTVAADSDTPKMVFRAKRVTKRLRFRPVIENGQTIETNDFDYDVRVRLRNGERVTKAETL